MLAFNAMKPARLSIALPVIDDSEYLKRPTQRAYTNIIAIVFFTCLLKYLYLFGGLISFLI